MTSTQYRLRARWKDVVSALTFFRRQFSSLTEREKDGSGVSLETSDRLRFACLTHNINGLERTEKQHYKMHLNNIDVCSYALLLGRHEQTPEVVATLRRK